MARLIDAKELERQVKSQFSESNPVLMGWILRRIRIQPTVDAVEVVHGRWINKTQVIHGQVDYMFVCSACGNIYWDSITDSFDYCPNCAAKMDLKGE